MSLRSTSLEFNDWRDNICTCPQQHLADDPYYQCAYCERRQEEADRDSDGTATAAINEDLSVPKDCQAPQSPTISKGYSTTKGWGG
jgi:hypothetical protein